MLTVSAWLVMFQSPNNIYALMQNKFYFWEHLHTDKNDASSSILII